MNKFKTFLIFILVGFLISCGGGSSVDPAPVDPAPDTITISWIAPTTYDDFENSYLPPNEIGSYNIYLGYSSKNYFLITPVDGTITTYQLNNLSPNTYYVAITTLDINGIESAFSEEKSKTIN